MPDPAVRVRRCASVCEAAAPPGVSVNNLSSRKLTLAVGKSTIVESSDTVRRVSVAAPEIADTIVLSARQVYVTGKASGVTTITLWGDANRVSAVFDVEILPDVAALKEKIHQIFPGEKDVKVLATHDSITLSGTVSERGEPHPARPSGRGLCSRRQDDEQAQGAEPRRGGGRPPGHAGGPRGRDVPEPDAAPRRQFRLHQRGRKQLRHLAAQQPHAASRGGLARQSPERRGQRELDHSGLPAAGATWTGVHRRAEGKRPDEGPRRADADHPQRPLRQLPGRRRVSHPRAAVIGRRRERPSRSSTRPSAWA